MKKTWILLLSLVLLLSACAAPAASPAAKESAAAEAEMTESEASPSAQALSVITASLQEGYYLDSTDNEYEYSYEIPAIVGQGPDLERLNRQLHETLMPRIEESDELMKSGSSLFLLEVGYQSFTNDGILSLLVTVKNDWDLTEYYAVNVNADGTEATRAQLLSHAGLTEEEFVSRAAEAVGLYFDQMYADVPAEAMSGFGYDLRERSTAAENFGPELPLFLDGEGRLCFAARVYSIAGAESYLHLVTLDGTPVD